MCWWRSSVHKSSFSSRIACCLCAGELFCSPAGAWTSYLNEDRCVDSKVDIRCFLTRKHRFQCVKDRETLLEKLIHEVKVKQRRNHDREEAKLILLYRRPEIPNQNIFLSAFCIERSTNFSHRGIVSFVLIEFLLNSMSKFNHSFIISAEKYRTDFSGEKKRKNEFTRGNESSDIRRALHKVLRFVQRSCRDELNVEQLVEDDKLCKKYRASPKWKPEKENFS